MISCIFRFRAITIGSPIVIEYLRLAMTECMVNGDTMAISPWRREVMSGVNISCSHSNFFAVTIRYVFISLFFFNFVFGVWLCGRVHVQYHYYVFSVECRPFATVWLFTLHFIPMCLMKISFFSRFSPCCFGFGTRSTYLAVKRTKYNNNNKFAAF